LFGTFVGFLAGGVPGAMIATFFIFLPSFVFVIGAARYVESLKDNRVIQAFLAGASAAVVGVIVVVSLELIPSAIVGLASIAIAVLAFLAIALLKIDIAFVSLGAMALGIVYMLARAMM
jgi:chromate transporter